jgi:tripartite-type tricarboxylate transporter receptor subunit TctC
VNHVIAQHFRTPEVRDQLFNSGVEAVANSPKEFADYMRSDMAKWGKLIGETGIRAE